MLREMIVGAWVGVCGVYCAQAQPDPDRAVANFDRMVAVMKAAQARLGPEADHLSGAVRHGFALLSSSDQIRDYLSQGTANDPAAASDLISRFAGSTQSEPSVGWWNNSAVIGFNDSGSLVQSLANPRPSPSGSFSFNGWSVASLGEDDGETPRFRDKGVLLPDPLPAGITFMFLQGDPVVRAGGPGVFYYSSIALDIDSTTNAHSDVTVSKSVDGGRTFGGAAIAIAKPYGTHILDKDWMAVSGNTILVTYRDADLSMACGAIRSGIELVRSTDGGVTWSAPVVLDSECGGTAFSHGPQVAFGPKGEVYAAWEHFAADFLTRELRFARSTDGGLHFGPVHVVSSITPVGDAIALQGYFRAFLDFQGLAVDASSGPFSGRVYVTWHDGRSLSQSDPFTLSGYGFYNFADVLLASSSDGGDTWTAPIRVNKDALTNKVDQFFPALAVDGSGQVGVLFYDRRNDPRNIRMNTLVAASTDGGASWQETKASANAFPPIVGQDFFVDSLYMGDYIGLAADASNKHHGFISAWGDNSLGDPNVQAARQP